MKRGDNMNFSIVFNRQFTNKVEMILHSPGNIPGKMFEMTLVIDRNLKKEDVEEVVPHLLRTLKRHSEVFLNVRLNVVSWIGDEQILNEITPMSMAMIKSYYEKYEQNIINKSYLTLMKNLKLFHARSKLVILVTDGMYDKSDEEEVKRAMQPFLFRKVLRVVVNDGVELG